MTNAKKLVVEAERGCICGCDRCDSIRRALGKALEESQYHYDCCGEEIATLRNALKAAEQGVGSREESHFAISELIEEASTKERTRIVKRLRAWAKDPHILVQRIDRVLLTIADEIEGKDD